MDKYNILKISNEIQENKLSKNCDTKLLQKIKTCFTSDEQKLFLMSFHSYIKYDKTNDFVVDLDDVWTFLGFGQKIKAKHLLQKHFKKDIDYKIPNKQNNDKKGSGGHNKEIILMNIRTFKKLCIKADTKDADNIHEYYIKLEEIIQEVDRKSVV